VNANNILIHEVQSVLFYACKLVYKDFKDFCQNGNLDDVHTDHFSKTGHCICTCPCYMGPSHRDMVCPQVVNGGYGLELSTWLCLTIRMQDLNLLVANKSYENVAKL
jgi:hypothetical protein